ncbi:hypothetical protein Baya_8065 [Bagarius yarrelli]|uniref:Uncharacterized protein n=1 Tax=Bagarius yarrelli TaxID=175774 RepID=A0A556U467_BAGYA|nr:hypothetical protein Baya_8065 [Bagarius yarrelli]
MPKAAFPSETGGSSGHVSMNDRRQEYAEEQRIERRKKERRRERETEMRKMSVKLSLPYVFPFCTDAPAERVQLLG